MEPSIIIPGLKESVIKACNDYNHWYSTRNLLMQWLKKESVEYQQLMSIPNSINFVLYSCLNGYIELISVFINNNFPVNYEINKSIFYFSNTMFHFATVGRQLRLMKYLISCGADVNYVSNAGHTPLHCLFTTERIFDISNADGKKLYSSNNQNSQIDVLKFLLDSGSNVDDKCKSRKMIPLHYAVLEGDIDCCKLLIDYGSDINAKDNFNATPLYFALISKHSALIELLLKRGAHASLGNLPEHVLLGTLIKGGLTIIELLLGGGVDVDEDYQTILYDYVFRKNPFTHSIEGGFVSENIINIVSILVVRGANISISDAERRNLLHWAAWQGNVPLVKLLMDRHLDVKDDFGKRPIHYAHDAGHDNVIQLFLDFYFNKFM